MKPVRAKKGLGQHFLKDQEIAARIVAALQEKVEDQAVLEIGPGMGILTVPLLELEWTALHIVEIDEESINYLKENLPKAAPHLIEGDFLKMDIHGLGNPNLAIIGNFPYNISSQILFKILDHVQQVNLLVGMFQKEVAERLASGAGSKKYGILSVLLQAYFDVDYLFTVQADKFRPPPKVESAVIRLTRNDRDSLGCDAKLFRKVVKGGFNHRRKTLRNSLKLTLGMPIDIDSHYLEMRAEQLSVDDFIALTNMLDKS
jgi:16S rRNA (adenine1518-N6/adenine1519-N6)-dimethyltransferase